MMPWFESFTARYKAITMYVIALHKCVCVFFLGEIYLSVHDYVLHGAIMYGCNYNTHAGSVEPTRSDG